ncbi:MAG TPA: DNA gyrase inhibitor YacG [Roseiarcus sp.]|nr:DNA gyrase inhibitor YacG [Roseiarcus sp.]
MKTPPANDNADHNGAPCPICGRPGAQRHRPFCTRRCADIDLHRWLVGAYVIASSGKKDDKVGSTSLDED